MYNYLESMKADIIDYIREDVNTEDYTSREELEERLNDDLWTADGVTGNASGSYTFNTYKAREYVIDNIDLLDEMCNEFGVDPVEIGQHFLNRDWEWMDVSIRCYLLGQAIAEALDEIENELKFAEEEQEA